MVAGAPERATETPAGAAAEGAAAGAPRAPAELPLDLDVEILRRLADGQGAREIAAQVARRMELPRRAVYQRVLELARRE